MDERATIVLDAQDPWRLLAPAAMVALVLDSVLNPLLFQGYYTRSDLIFQLVYLVAVALAWAASRRAWYPAALAVLVASLVASIWALFDTESSADTDWLGLAVANALWIAIPASCVIYGAARRHSGWLLAGAAPRALVGAIVLLRDTTRPQWRRPPDSVTAIYGWKPFVLWVPIGIAALVLNTRRLRAQSEEAS